MKLRREYMDRHGGFYDALHNFGTVSSTSPLTELNRTPVKNWAGVGVVDFPQGIKEYAVDNVMRYQNRRYACWKCTIGCGGEMEVKEPGPYQGTKHHKVEYETAGAFGSLTLTADFAAIVKLNELCNRYGFDTMSAGGVVAFAIECFENGILTERDTDGLALRWGNAEAIIALLHKMARREGIGDVLADGVQRAAAKIGHGADAFAMHVGGQEMSMHDPRFLPGYITTYILDPTPARHTQGGENMIPMGVSVKEFDIQSTDPHNRADLHQIGVDLNAFINSTGMCTLVSLSYPWTVATDFMEAVTGWEWPMDLTRKTGERIATLRHLFNLRDGINPLNHHVPGRIVGDPPLSEGPTKGRTVDYKTMLREYLEYADWDLVTTVPSRKKLEELGLRDEMPLFHPA